MNALQQFLQAASNEAAGAVSGPVDLIGMGLRKIGVPVPSNALMSSDWMRQNGLMQDVPQNAASLAGQTFGLLSPVVAAAKAPQIAGGLLKAGKNLAAPSTIAGPSAGQRGMLLYHGTNDAQPLKQINPRGGVFGGLFASQERDAALSHGDRLYRMTVPDEKVLTQRALDYEIPPEQVRRALEGHLRGPLADDIAEMVVSGRDVYRSSIPEDELLSALRAEDLGEASWELQRLRGLLSSKLGYKAVEMPDEHGMSYLVAPGTNPRPANNAAKDLFRKPK